jgi:hypothetical protein
MRPWARAGIADICQQCGARITFWSDATGAWNRASFEAIPRKEHSLGGILKWPTTNRSAEAPIEIEST